MPLMLYPLMTHLPEELWYSVTAESEPLVLALQSWSVVDEVALDDELETSFAELIAVIRMVGHWRAVAGLTPSQSLPVRFVTDRPALVEVFGQGTSDITSLTRVKSVQLMTPADAEAAPVAAHRRPGELEASQARLEKDIAKPEKEI